MKGRMVIGTLLIVSVALCSQGFGFDLLDNMLGLNKGCCGPACCDPCGEAKACSPEPACCAVENPGCRAPRRPICDLFSGLRGLLCCECGTCDGCRPNACDPCSQVKACDPEPAACDPAPAACDPCQPKYRPQRVCRPKACKPNCCEPCCKPRRCKPTPVRDFLEDLFCCRPCCTKSCCEPAACGPVSCEPACGGCGVETTTAAPAKAAPAEEAAPLPKAPTADPSASLHRTRNILQASRNVVSN